MFVFNLNFSKSKILKIIILVLIFIAISILVVSIIKMSKEILNSSQNNLVSDSIVNDVAILNSKNYTNVLKEVHDDLDTYIGQKISFTGYVYRVMDIKEDEFILARNMVINSNNQTLVVGFLCQYDDAKSLQDNAWVNITGTIEKGSYYGEIPCIKIEKLEIVNKPEDDLVYPPDENYVPTSIIY
ncbi:MAG: hypothetical protein ACI4UE_02955 [Candidatus Scatovivens sp.]